MPWFYVKYRNYLKIQDIFQHFNKRITTILYNLVVVGVNLWHPNKKL